ncbi:protein D2-like [Tetranychus urticae]|nr:protein D2-like [Tetranychus urticae]
MLDIDAPSPSAPIMRSFIHWMVVNALGGQLEPQSTVHPYISPMPTPGLGAHRYVFMVFEQPKGFTIDPNATVLDRNKFNVAEWVKQNTLFGPVAGNYFLEGNPPNPKFNLA